MTDTSDVKSQMQGLTETKPGVKAPAKEFEKSKLETDTSTDQINDVAQLAQQLLRAARFRLSAAKNKADRVSELHYIHEVLKRKTLPDSEWHVLKDIVKEPGIDAASKGVFPSRSKAILTGTLANNSPHLSYASIESAKVHFETGYKIADRLIEKNAYYAAAFVNQAAIKAEIMHDAMKKLMDYSVGKVPYSIEDRFTEIQSCLDDYKLLSGKNLKIEGSPQEYYEKFFKRPNMIGIDFAAVEGVCNLF